MSNAHRSPIHADGDRLVTTYGEVRRHFRSAEIVRENYSSDVRRAEGEADVWREWALELERLALRDHPARKGRCPSCGKVTPCPTRRAVNKVRRDAVVARQRRDAEYAAESQAVAAKQIEQIRNTRPRG